LASRLETAPINLYLGLAERERIPREIFQRGYFFHGLRVGEASEGSTSVDSHSERAAP